MRGKELAIWQKELTEQQKVYFVWNNYDNEITGNFYDTFEGAEMEADYCNKMANRRTRYVVKWSRIHNEKLAKQRWKH